MRTFPKSFFLNIFGKKIKVKTVKGLREQGIAGLFSPSSLEILISEEQTKECAIETLIHEVVHSVINRTGINQSLSHELEEVICENVSKAICENFKLALKR